jgi:site-specific DNA recombinase
MTDFLSNPFYVGLFRYGGEVYEGKHQPILSKQLFDKVQQVLRARSKPQKVVNEPKPFCGLLICGECGRSITACTKKNVICSQPYIRGEVLTEQLSNILKDFALPDGWAAELYRLADKDKQDAAHSPMRESRAIRSEIASITEKLQRLFDAYLEEDIERNAYRSEKIKLLSRKKSLKERLPGSSRGFVTWLEPLRDWIKDADTIGETAVSSDLPL